MEEQIIFNTEVKTGRSTESVKSVRAEIRQLTQEMANLDPGSKAFTVAAQRAGVLRDKMQDAQMAIKAFNPEAKFQAFAGVLGGVANGFAAAQGAIALFGSESEDLNKVIVRTQGAIALATGLNGILGMKDQLVVMASVIRTNVVAAFATMRSAIISTGILGLVALLGTLIYQWYETKTATDEAAKSLEKYQKIAQENQELAIRNLKGRAKESAELTNKQTKEILDLLELEKKGELTREERLVKQNLLYSAHLQEQKELKDKWAKEDAETEKQRNEKQLAERQKQADKLKAIDDWENENIREGNAKLQEDKDKEAEREKERKRSLIESSREQYQYESDLAKQLAQDKIDALETSAQALAGFAQLAGQETAAGKALAIATTTIDTYVAAQSAYKSASAIPGVGIALAPIAAAAAVAAGLARVKAIMAVQIPGGYNVSMPAMGGVNSAPPVIRPSVNGVKVDNSAPLRTAQTSPQRVYVLESDITNKQANVDSIRIKATIK